MKTQVVPIRWLRLPGLALTLTLLMSLLPIESIVPRLAVPTSGVAEAAVTPLPGYASDATVYAPGEEANPLLWDVTWGADENSEAPHDISPDGEGNVFAVINSRPVGGSGLTALLVKFSQNGAELWHRELGRVYSLTFSVAADKSGNVFVYGPGQTNQILRKYDSAGNTLWEKDFDSGYESQCISTDLLGNVYITRPLNAAMDVELIKYSASGSELWRQTIGTTGHESAVAVSSQLEEVYVVGKTNGSFPGKTFSGNGMDGFLAKFSDNGTAEWIKQYAGLYFTDLTIDTAGNAYTIETELYNGYPAGVNACAFDREGNIKTRIPLYFDPTERTSIAVDGWRNIYVAGAVEHSGLNFPDMQIEKYDALGKAQWERKINLGVGPFEIRTGKFGDLYAAYFQEYENPYNIQTQIVKYRGDDDTDGDGIPDRWETYGVWVKNTFIDLPAMGAKPDHKDIFVQVDSMLGQEPKAGALDIVVKAFKNAPVDNPDGTKGINLHVDAGPGSMMNPQTSENWSGRSEAHVIPNKDTLGSRTWFGFGDGYVWDDFDEIKESNFSQARAPIFHYCVFANKLGGWGTTSGMSRDIPASDFIVSLGGWNGGKGGEPLQQAGTFMHELGHNLGLRHGGVDDISYKPNYLSIMNYAFQSGGLIKLADDNVTYTDGTFDYSVFGDIEDLNTSNLDEARGITSSSNDTKLDNYGTRYYWTDPYSTVGVLDFITAGPRPIDWNNSTVISYSANVVAPYIAVGPSGSGYYGGNVTLKGGGEDWHRLQYRGGAIGQFGASFNELPGTTEVLPEFTWEDEQAQGHANYVAVTSPENSGVTPGGSSTAYTFTVTNSGRNSDTYSISAVSSAGWADLSGLPQTVTLASNATAQISIEVSVPADGAGNDDLTLTAVSQTSANIWGSGKVTTVAKVVSVGTEQVITSLGTWNAPEGIVAYGDWIAWMDLYHGGSNFNFGLNVRNIVTGEQRFVDYVENQEQCLYFDMYGTNLVYRPDTARVMLYDLSDNTSRQISPYWAGAPAIDGDKVVYSVSINGIYVYDLTNNAYRQITHPPDAKSAQTYPDISGDKIVWEDERNGNHDIYMYDLTTDTERAICTNPSEQVNVRIDGNKIVWDDNRGGFWNIYMYDLSTSTETPITNHTTADWSGNYYQYAFPSVSGDRIVGFDHPMDEQLHVWNQVCMYDSNTGAKSVIAGGIGSNVWAGLYGAYPRSGPSIRGNEIAYFKDTPVPAFSHDICVTHLSAAPGTSLSTIPLAPGADGWFTTAPEISLTADTEGASVFYQWDSNSGLGWSSYAGNFTAAEGQHSLFYYSADDLGNTESVKSQTFRVDVTPPTTSLSTTPSGNEVIADVFTVTPQIAMTASELGSLSYYQWDSSNGAWSDYSSPFLGLEGEHTLYYCSVDPHGNTEVPQSWSFDVDTVPDTTEPFTTIVIEPPLEEGDRYFGSSPIITLSANETAVTYYSWDTPFSGIPQNPVLPDFSGEDAYAPTTGTTVYWGGFLAPRGEHTLYYCSVDPSGNIEELKSQDLIVGDVPPVALSQSVSTLVNTPKCITLEGYDPDGDNITFNVVMRPLHGVLTGASANLTYTPSDNFTGNDSFTFKATDSQADSNIAFVSITVRPPNRPPVANNDTYSIAHDHVLNVAAPGVLGNDSDPDGDTLTAAIVSTSSNGTLNLSPTGAFAYAPSANFTGSDNFTYKANDGQLDSSVATVTITVTAGATNHAPVANNQALSTTTNTPVQIVLTASDQDGDSLAFSIVVAPSHGTLSATAPNLIYSPATGFAGNDSLTFKANDGQADSNAAQITIAVIAPAVNYAPVYSAPPPPQMSVNPPLSVVGGQLTIAGSHFTPNEPVTVYLDGNLIGNAHTDSSGALPETDLRLPATAHGSHTIKVMDTMGHSATATFSTKEQITISPDSGPCTTTMTVKGNGFNANATITLTFGEAAVGSSAITTDANGSFGPVTVSVPVSSRGSHNVKASDGANTDGSPFSVSATAIVSPREGYVGSQFIVDGSGFGVAEQVSIGFDGSTVKTVTTDASGSFSVPVDVPEKTAGTYTISVTEGNNNLDTYFAITTSVSLSPATSALSEGFVGQQVAVKGEGFVAGNTVTIAYDGQQLATGTVAADNTFSIPFTVPASKAGDHAVTVKDSLNDLPLTFVMESTAPPVPTLLTPLDETGTKSRPSFGWTAVTDPSGVTYDLQVATSPDFSQKSIVSQKSGLTACECSAAESDKLKPAAYYWRIRAVDGASNASPYSTPRSFRVSSGLPVWAIIVIIAVAAALVGLLAFFRLRRKPEGTE